MVLVGVFVADMVLLSDLHKFAAAQLPASADSNSVRSRYRVRSGHHTGRFEKVQQALDLQSGRLDRIEETQRQIIDLFRGRGSANPVGSADAARHLAGVHRPGRKSCAFDLTPVLDCLDHLTGLRVTAQQRRGGALICSRPAFGGAQNLQILGMLREEKRKG